MNPPRRRPADYRIDPFDLQLFVAVVEAGSLTAGAQACSLSLAAASTRIAALEHRVGTRLLARAKNGTTPTDAGVALVQHAQRVLGELTALHVEMAAFGRGLRGTVRLLCNTAAAAGRLPRQLGRFLRAHPDVDVDLQERGSDEVLHALHRGSADVGIVADHVDTAGLEAWPWAEDTLVAVLPAAHPAAGRDTLTHAELLDQPFVGLGAERGLSRFLARQAAQVGRVPQHRVRVGGFEAAVPLVAAGVGVAVMPQGAAARWRSDGVAVVPLADAWAHRRLHVCCTTTALQRSATRALVETLRAPDGDGAIAR